MRTLAVVIMMVSAPTQAAWYVDAKIQSEKSNMDLTNDNVTVWAPIPGNGDSSIKLMENSAPAFIGCAGDQMATGATCPNDADEENGIAITPDETADYDVCNTTSFEAGVGSLLNFSGGHVIDALQIVLTGNTDHTPVSLDGPVTEFGFRIAGGVTKNMNEHSVQTCRVFHLTGGQLATLRLFYKQKVSQNVAFVEALLGGAYANTPEGSSHWTVRKIK